MDHISKIKKNGGQALLMGVLLFLFLSTSFITGISTPILRHANVTNDLLTSRKSYFMSEAGVEDATYRIKNNKQISSTENLSLDGVTVTTSIADTSGMKTIEAVGNGKNLIRKVETVLETGMSSPFTYGIQTGAGGFILGNNATINGSVYANGSIVGSNGARVTGSATSAVLNDQINNTPMPPQNSIVVGVSNAVQDFGQSFQVSASLPLNKISVYIKKVGMPANLTVRITTDGNGKPSTNTLTSAVLSNSLVTDNFAWVDIALPNDIQLTPGVTYWFVLDGATSLSSYYMIAANISYAVGQGRLGQYGGDWNTSAPAGFDGYFKIYLVGSPGLISDVSVGTSGVGSAEAYQVNNSTVTGALYCQVGLGNNKACNTSKPIPDVLDFAISDDVINQWKSDATAGGIINGNYTVSSSMSLGPKKIVGDLTINNNTTLTLTGTIWVTGNIDIRNGVTIQLSSSYGANSGVLITDGHVGVSNNSVFAGSGQSGSYVIVFTTSDCPLSYSCSGNYAMNIFNNVGAVILDAQNGTIYLNNNATANQLTAHKTILGNGATVNYEQSIANTNFTNGPTGGWTIKSWAETE